MLADIHQRVTKEPAKGDEGTLAATILQMPGDELQEIARWIFDTATEVERRFWAGE